MNWTRPRPARLPLPLAAQDTPDAPLVPEPRGARLLPAERQRAIDELQDRVASRLSHGEDDESVAGDAAAERMRTRSRVVDELQSWSRQRAMAGREPLALEEEDSLVEDVLAAVRGLGPLEALLMRDDIEDIFFNGTAPTVLRLRDGRMVDGPRLGETDERVQALIEGLAARQEGGGRDFSRAKPLLALRMPAVGLMGAQHVGDPTQSGVRDAEIGHLEGARGQRLPGHDLPAGDGDRRCGGRRHDRGRPGGALGHRSPRHQRRLLGRVV